MALYTADFETTTDENDCRVWAWSVSEIGNPDFFEYGNSIESFFRFLENSENSTFWFHNLKFDSDFMFVYLFENGFHHVENRKEERSKTFSTLISDMGQFYTVKIMFEKTKKKSKYVKIHDSLKLLPFPVREVASAFDLPISKLHLDYNTFREIGHVLTDHEIKYIRSDTDIVARALNVLFTQGQSKITTASNALEDYKQRITPRRFKKWFPILHPTCDADIRRTYRGGFTYMNPRYYNEDIGEGLVFDYNSMYPYVMHECPLPCGEPVFFEGEYQPDPIYNLYVQRLECQFELKPGHIPTLQLKGNFRFVQTEYITSSKDKRTGIDKAVTMDLTSVDLELFKEHYEIYNVTYINGWKFQSKKQMFVEYIDYWTNVKIEATKTKNKAMRTLAKLMLNSLYGKFGSSIKTKSKFPYYDDGKISFRTGEEESKEPIYIPVATFVTSWARYTIIKAAQKVYHMFAYADTDSLHLEINLPDGMKDMTDDELSQLTTEDLQRYGLDIPSDFNVDPVKLGALKIEGRFHRARYIRAKCYVEDMNPPETWDKFQFNSKDFKECCEDLDIDYKTVAGNYDGWYDRSKFKITCAGMPPSCYEFVTWENFHEGSSYAGKLLPKHVKGGTVLCETDFTIKPTGERLKKPINLDKILLTNQ